MKAIVLRETGGPEALRLEEFPDPTPGPGEALVRVHAAALNHRDVWIRKGQYAGIQLPLIPGSDGAGEVIAVGEGVDDSFIGWEVVINPAIDWGGDPRVQGKDFRILGLPDHGTFAELVCVPASQLHTKPASMSFEEAAALPLAGLTAFRAVVTRAAVQPDEIVLVTGVGGGVAAFAVQMARYSGARVFVTSSSPNKIAKAVELGAEGGLDYRDAGWVKQMREMTEGGPHVIIDSAGGPSFDQLLDLARPGGRIVTYGATLGAAPELQIRRIFWKQLSVLGSTMGTNAEFVDMLRWFEAGALQSVVDRVYPLAEAGVASAHMEQAEQFGKIILVP